MNSDGRKISYKNVHKRIQKLHSVGLIERVNKGEANKHAAIFYRLTSFGVYYGIRNNLASVEILLNHSKDPLFEIIMYPFISKKTMKGIKGRTTLVHIKEHLLACCEIIEERLRSFEQLKESGGGIELLCRWDQIIDPSSFGLESFLKFLKNSLAMKWVDSDLDITQHAQNIIKISGRNHTIYLKLLDSKAILFDGNRKVHQFDVAHGYHPGLCYGRVVPTLVGIGKFRPFNLKSECLEMFQNIHQKVVDKAFEFCFALVKNYNSGSAHEDEVQRVPEDYKSLAADENFRRLFEKTSSRFATYRNKFVKLKEQMYVAAA
jgi:hypothetical protein